MAGRSGIDADIAFGEALGTSLLLGAMLKHIAQKGIMTDAEIADLIDQVLRGLENIQGHPEAPQKAVARARRMVEGLLTSFASPRR